MPIRSLGLLALVLVLFFALQLVGALLPFQPLDPAWQWRFSKAVVSGATLLLIAGQLDPDDPVLKQRRRLFGQLAVAAAIGFLLLLPLQLSAGLRQQQAAGSAQLSRIASAEQRLTQLRQRTTAATSVAELNAVPQKLGGPVLRPSDLAQPLPLP